VVAGTSEAAVALGSGERRWCFRARERERELFKEKGSISFLSWNSYSAPILIVPIGLAHQAIYQGVLIDLDPLS
jgi:hypothetical protein